jgi:hypothetical protein
MHLRLQKPTVLHCGKVPTGLGPLGKIAPGSQVVTSGQPFVPPGPAKAAKVGSHWATCVECVIAAV